MTRKAEDGRNSEVGFEPRITLISAESRGRSSEREGPTATLTTSNAQGTTTSNAQLLRTTAGGRTSEGQGLKLSINFGAMLNTVDADKLLRVIDPIENSPGANPEFAQSGKVVGHADEPTVHHY
jgi:hypothetical protein